MKGQFAAVLLSMMLQFVPAVSAAPPWVSDDPEPVHYRRAEVFFSSAGVHTDEPAHATTGSLPQVEINVGVKPNLEIHLLAPLTFATGARGGWNSGYGDTEFGVKQSLIDEGRYVPHIGIAPLVIFGTGNEKEGTGYGASRLFLPVLFQKRWEEWTSFGGPGYSINHGKGDRDSVFVGGVLTRTFEWGAPGMEFFFRSSDKTGVRDSFAVNVGFVIDLDEDFHLLLSSGRDISGPNVFMYYAGCLVRF